MSYSQADIKRIADNFWKKVNVTDREKCWEWMRSLTKDGYGQFSHRSRGKLGLSIRASRAAWQITNGEIPEGLFVLHKCDNRLCCNPSHLFLGTHKENMLDMKNKNRQSKGTKWSEEDRKRISERMKGERNHRFGKTFSQETIEKMKLSQRKRRINECLV